MDEIYKLLKLLSKKSNLTILLSLKNGSKRWSDLSSILYPRDLHKGLRELIDNGFIEVTIIRDTPTGSKAYQLSPLGKKIVKLLEEMQEEFEKYHYIPESDEEFLEGNWRRD